MTLVAVVEPNDALRETLCRWIDSSPDCRCVCSDDNGEQALLEIPSNRPSVVMMDIHLKNGSGIYRAARLKERWPELQIIMLAMEKNHDLAFEALKSGACGYLLIERTSRDEILWAIAEAQAGGAPMTGIIARRVIEVFQQSTAFTTELTELSPREIEVLRGLSTGLSNKQIAAHLSITYGTACVHLRRIYDKLRVRSRTEAVLKYFQSQTNPERMIGAAHQREKGTPLSRLEFLHAENLRLAAELEHNVREVIQLSAANRLPLEKGLRTNRGVKSTCHSQPVTAVHGVTIRERPRASTTCDPAGNAP